MMEIFCHTYSYMPMIGFNMNGKSSNAHLDFIRKETGKVNGYVPAAPPNPRVSATAKCVGRTMCVKVIAFCN